MDEAVAARQQRSCCHPGYMGIFISESLLQSSMHINHHDCLRLPYDGAAVQQLCVILMIEQAIVFDYSRA